MDEFTHTMLSSVDVNSAQNEFYVLSIFALEHRRLQAAGSLLPDLLELYHWIHNELAYLVTCDEARSLTIEDVIEKHELVQLYVRVTGMSIVIYRELSWSVESLLYLTFSDGYNSYVEMVGQYNEADTDAGVMGKEGANKISNSTKFIDFLSAKTEDEQLESRDLLYLVINDIVRVVMITFLKL